MKIILNFILYGFATYLLVLFVLAMFDLIVKSPEERRLNRLLNSKNKDRQERDDVVRKRQIHKSLKNKDS